MLFSLKFQRDNRQNALALYSAKRKTGEKRLYFHRTIEMKQPHTMTEPFHLEECGFRFNHRHENICKLILKMLRENLSHATKEKPGERHFRAKFDAVIELNALEGAVGGLLGDEAGAWGQVQGEDACGIR